MVSEKDKLIKQLTEKRNKLYDTHNDELFKVRLIELRELLLSNTRTQKIIHDLKASSKANDKTSMKELARSKLQPIDDIIANYDSGFAYYLQYVTDTGWDRARFKRVTEGYVDPIITYTCETLEAEEPETPHDAEKTVDPAVTKFAKFMSMVKDNIEKNPVVPKSKRDTLRDFTISQKNLMITAQDNKCAWCGKPIYSITSQADHKIPWERGGRTELSNGWALCLDCHSKKTAIENVFSMENKRQSKREAD